MNSEWIMNQPQTHFEVKDENEWGSVEKKDRAKGVNVKTRKKE